MIGSLATNSKKILFEACMYMRRSEMRRKPTGTLAIPYNQSLKDVASLYIFVSRELYSDYKR